VFGYFYKSEAADPITYETGTREPIHPDPAVASRFHEVAMSNCPYGCKVYADTQSRVRVLAHNSNYGCIMPGHIH
jgi:hypothetical protein